MNRRWICFLMALFAPVIARGAEPSPAMAVWIESFGKGAAGTDSGPHFISAVWPDGRIVWSRDQQAGGPPYLTASIEPARITKLLKQFEQRGVFNRRGARRLWFGPDSSFHAIWLQSGTRHTRLETWHELFERNPKLVVINGGVTSLDGRSREEAIRGDTKEFREFRHLWSDLRAAMTALIPPSGKGYSGALAFKLPK